MAVSRSLDVLRKWAVLLDSRFRVPGTKIRFGLDPILSLIPGLGELSSPVYTALLLGQGLRQRVPKIILLRMVGNALLDAAIGAVPLLGTVGDVFWRANTANLALLDRHSTPGRPPTRADYAFVTVLALLLGILIAIPVLLSLWLATALWQVIAEWRWF